jgi:hypothetical protein
MSNPALLAGKPKLSFTGGMSFVQTNESLRSFPFSLSEKGASYQMTTSPRFFPLLAIAGKPFVDGLWTGLSFAGLEDRERLIDDDSSPLRYGVVKSRCFVNRFSFAAAWRGLGDRLAIGGAFSIYQIGLWHDRHIWAGTDRDATRPIEDVARDMLVQLRMRDRFVPAGSLGVWARPARWLRLSASFHARGRAEPEGRVRLTGPHPAVIVEQGSGEASARLNLPLTVTAALELELDPVRFLVSSAYDWSRDQRTFASLDPVRVRPFGTPAGGRIDTVPFPGGYPAGSLTLAGAVEVGLAGDRLSVRTGLSGTAPVGQTSGAGCGTEQMGRLRVGTGATLVVADVKLHVAYGLVALTGHCLIPPARNPLGGPDRNAPVMRVSRRRHAVSLSMEVSLF